MKKIGIILALVLATVGCRKESDVILSYGKKDALTFSEASQSFTAQFQALWTGLNCNYGIWDYEMQHGLDWDAVYREYLPLMEELDQRAKVHVVFSFLVSALKNAPRRRLPGHGRRPGTSC